METTKREIVTGGELRDAPGHYTITVSLEGDDELAWDVLRKPDGTYWDIAGINLCPFRIALGNQIVDAKALRLCDQNYGQIKDTEVATIRILGLRKLVGTDPQRFELQLYDMEEKTRGYTMTTKYGTEKQIRAIFQTGGLTEGQIEFYFARAS